MLLVLAGKDARIIELEQQQLLSEEMEERMQKAYEEFNALREKLMKVESLSNPPSRQFEFEELQQNHFKLIREFDEYKQKHLSLLEENQRLSRLLADTEEKLRESNFQRQQLQKKITFLEELNRDLQQISEHNKKLENQLRRMSEIEVMLARVQGKGKKGENEPPE
jgi:myosin heavy subunit